jgi:hypothetical protein
LGENKHASADHQRQQFYQYGGMLKTAPIPIGKRVVQKVKFEFKEINFCMNKI